MRDRRPRSGLAHLLGRAGRSAAAPTRTRSPVAPPPSVASADELRRNGAAGTPAEVLETIGRYADIGAERVYLQVLDLADLDHLRLVAAEVLPHV